MELWIYKSRTRHKRSPRCLLNLLLDVTPDAVWSITPLRSTFNPLFERARWKASRRLLTLLISAWMQSHVNAGELRSAWWHVKEFDRVWWQWWGGARRRIERKERNELSRERRDQEEWGEEKRIKKWERRETRRAWDKLRRENRREERREINRKKAKKKRGDGGQIERNTWKKSSKGVFSITANPPPHLRLR